MKNFIVTGAASGLGKAICEALHDNGKEVLGIDKKDISPSLTSNFPYGMVDVTNPKDIKTLKDYCSSGSPTDCVVNCAGINFISEFGEIKEEDFDRVIATNVKSVLLVSQAFLPMLRLSKGTILNVVSNASHQPMTHSFVYNASKGALEIATKQMARELTKAFGITVFGISPNKLAGTEMSRYIDETFPPMRGLTYEEGRKYQLNGLLTGKETDPKQIAELVAFLLDRKERHEYLSGCILPLGL